jgi:hypothetical protein
MTTTQPSDPLPPGTLRLLHLQSQGRLQEGDTLETSDLGRCTVTIVKSFDSIVVTNLAGKLFNISGLNCDAKLVQATS